MSVFGWIIIHQRLGFNGGWHVYWANYKAGFGSIDADFWFGLEKVHLLTSSQPYRLRVEMQQSSSNLWYSAEYWSFKIGDELDEYRLEVSGYSGDAGDALLYEGDRNGDGLFGDYLQNGMNFTTQDRDNDQSAVSNCASHLKGGWWHNTCVVMACLTCRATDYMWDSLDDPRLVSSRMMIKPK